MAVALRVAGLIAAAAIASGAWFAYDSYGQFANIGRWTGEQSLNWLRPWLTEFRMPLLCTLGFLSLTALSWVWSKLGLGH